MEAKDLMIGNYVTYMFSEDFRTIIEVESITNEGINVYASDDNAPYGMHSPILEHEYSFEELRPIPLTEEWLLKFGFHEKYKSVSNRWNIGSFYLHDNENEFGDLSGVFMYDYFLEVKSVHQLQNLYKSLTGEELKIK
jgi:hypothetical protein